MYREKHCCLSSGYNGLFSGVFVISPVEPKAGSVWRSGADDVLRLDLYP